MIKDIITKEKRIKMKHINVINACTDLGVSVEGAALGPDKLTENLENENINRIIKIYADEDNKEKSKENLRKNLKKVNEFNENILLNANESKIAIEKSSIQVEGRKYSEYQKTRYQEIKRFYKLKQQLEYLDKYNIKSFEKP